MGLFSFWENMIGVLLVALLRWPDGEGDGRGLALAACVGVGDGDFVAGLVREDDRLDVAGAAHRPSRYCGDQVAGHEPGRCSGPAGDEADDRRALAREGRPVPELN